MLKLALFVSLAVMSLAFPQKPNKIQLTPNYTPHEFELEQNRAAKYQFSSQIDDKISDLTNQREEVRDGLNVKGMYSFSDGFFQTIVQYVADQNGYRELSRKSVPLGGPMVDLTGTASVSNSAHGKTLAYVVQSVPKPGPVPQIITEA